MALISPRVAWITTNRSCNFRCPWCYTKGENFDAKQTLSFDLALKLLSIVKQIGIKHLLIIGGEPTLWKHLLDFNCKCREVGIKTTLVTNALRFSDDKFWFKYLEKPNDKVGPSIKAFDEPSLQRLAQFHDFESVRKGLTRLVAKFKCGVTFVHNSFARNDLVLLARFAKSCGANRIGISPCTPSFSDKRPGTTGMIPLKEVVADVVSQYQQLHDLMDGKLTLALKIPFCLWPKSFIEKLKERRQLHSGCQFQNRSGIAFGPQGELLACNSMAEFPIGKFGKDYDDGESLISLLNSDKVTRSYDRINSYPSEKCVDCSQVGFCGGGCPLMWTVYDAKASIPGW
ncbi:MAG: radical SAM protein [Candidatus Vogelbacteria bacterium]